ncbi:MAG: hypothetical protein AABZ53_09910, partial [Planctomycetota bacterium]
MTQPSEQPEPTNPDSPIETPDAPPEAPVPTEPIATAFQPRPETSPTVSVPGGTSAGSPAPSTRAEQLSKVWIFVGVLIVLTILGGVAITRYRKVMLGTADEPDDTKGLMDSLRALRDSGEMSEEEYQQTRRKLTEQMAARFEDDAIERRERRAKDQGKTGGGSRGRGGEGGCGVNGVY